MLHVYFHLKTFVNDNQVNDRLIFVLILKILILDFVADGGHLSFKNTSCY